MSGEEEIITDGARANMQGAFQTPEILQALGNRFDTLQGRSSGYVEKLPANVQNRIAYLKNLSKENSKIQSEFEKELLQLEQKYHVRHTVLFEKRKNVINGEYEPTKEEYKIEGEDNSALPPADDKIKGIPEFWLTVLKNVPPLSDQITEKDEPALKHLIDVEFSILEDLKGYKISFHFSENPFFTDSVLSKTYHVDYEHENEENNDYTEGSTINWKEGKDLTVKVEIKKQRHKSSNKVRTVKKSIPCDSFFNFFNSLPRPSEGEEVDDDVWEAFESEFELGDLLKEQVIPKAVKWFTGEAVEEFYNNQDDDEYDSEDEDDGLCS